MEACNVYLRSGPTVIVLVRRLKSGEQLQHPNVSREKQENIAAKLKKTLPMELPLLNKRFVTQSAARRHGPKHEQRREEGAGEKSARNVMQGSRQPPPPRTKRSLSLPCSTLPVHHLHHHRHRPFEGRPHAASIRAPPSRHPATFPDMKYRSGRSSHQPGLRFFEYIPSRSFISMAATVAFLGPEAAKRVSMFYSDEYILRDHKKQQQTILLLDHVCVGDTPGHSSSKLWIHITLLQCWM